jgi:hypothetical protein
VGRGQSPGRCVAKSSYVAAEASCKTKQRLGGTKASGLDRDS